MITQRELDGAIKECENAPTSYQNCEKLATFYTIREHAFREDSTPVVEQVRESIIDDYGDSDFLQEIKGRSEAEMWLLMDELMQTILITNPRLYQGVMRKIKGQL